MHPPILIKLGGSLIRRPKEEVLRPLGQVISRLPGDHPLLIVPGGGPFADTVRHYGEKLSLGEETCHFMALAAMDQCAFLLQELIPGSRCTDLSATGFSPCLFNHKGPHILLCASYFRQVSAACLPRTWDVTSDSLAAYLAREMQAFLLVLVKSTDIDPRMGEPDVDAFFSRLLPLETPVWFINGRDPDRLARLFHTGRTAGVHLPPYSLSGRIVP